jgi:hypothetical protein
MNTKPTETPLDRVLLDLRSALASTLTIVGVLRTLRPRGDALLPHLYGELQTLLRVERRARAVLRRYVPPERSAS